MSQVLTLAGETIKQPTNFRIGKFNLTKAGRTADGKMHMDLIAKKKKFFFEYDVLDGDDLTTIENIVDGDDLFFTITYKENDVEYSKTVYPGATEKTQFRTDGRWYWKDVSFDLIEQ